MFHATHRLSEALSSWGASLRLRACPERSRRDLCILPVAMDAAEWEQLAVVPLASAHPRHRRGKGAATPRIIFIERMGQPDTIL